MNDKIISGPPLSGEELISRLEARMGSMKLIGERDDLLLDSALYIQRTLNAGSALKENPDQYVMPGTLEHKKICDAADADWVARGGKLGEPIVTPGKWMNLAIINGSKKPGWENVKPVIGIAAENSGKGEWHVATQDDQNLMVAAKDMAEALETVISTFDGEGTFGDIEAYEKARAALAKAGIK